MTEKTMKRRSASIDSEILDGVSLFARKHKLTKLAASDLLMKTALNFYKNTPSLLDRIADEILHD